ncbi:MAG: DUF4105 domain-containing protein [Cystobacterineae bacterium]|nr:DUF4105 domain-containing protein [Cystobacterineae bacterium]
MVFSCSAALLLAHLLLLSQVSSPVEEEAPSPPQILLATFGPGDEVAAWWGHIAFVVEEPKRLKSRMYNYGAFEVSPEMLPRFAMGRLEFFLDVTSVMPVLNMYAQEDRHVRLSLFHLTPKEAQGMAAALEENALPDNRTYLYHHYNDNCATRVRDLLDGILGGQFSAWLKQQPARMSIREHTRRYSAVNGPMLLLLDFFQNDELDKPISAFEEAFLPDELEKRILQFSIYREAFAEPLVSKVWDFSKNKVRPSPRESTPQTEWPCLGLGLSFAMVLGLLGHWASKGRRWARWGLGLGGLLWFLFWGFLGSILLAMEFTNHTVTHGNENLFLAHPLFWLGGVWAWAFARKGARRSMERLAWLCCCLAGISWLGVGLKWLPVFDQNNWNILALALPAHSALALVFVALARKQTTPTPPAPAQELPDNQPSLPAPKTSGKKNKRASKKAGKK